MRRFSSEGSLLCLDIFPWKTVSQKDVGSDEVDGSRTCKTPPRHGKDVDHGASSLPATPATLQEARNKSATELSKELSFSVEDLTGLDVAPGLLKVTNLNESFKAYSDSQLAPHTLSSADSVEKDSVPPSPSPSSTLNPFSFHSGSGTHQNRHHVRSKLSSAKLHLKSLFGQVRGEKSIVFPIAIIYTERELFTSVIHVNHFSVIIIRCTA